MIDVETLGAATLGAVPFLRTLGVEFVAVADGGATVTVRLPDAPELHNHLGGPHAGALFTLAEAASGAVATGVFADQLGRVTMLPVRADVAYRKVARGTVQAIARLTRTREEVLAELESGGRADFPVAVEVTREDGTVTT